MVSGYRDWPLKSVSRAHIDTHTYTRHQTDTWLCPQRARRINAHRNAFERVLAKKQPALCSYSVVERAATLRSGLTPLLPGDDDKCWFLLHSRPSLHELDVGLQ